MSSSQQPYTPVFIIGCPRSGTNILRDVLSSHPLIATWPCDELNQLWRYNNYSSSSDLLTIDNLTPQISSYIHRFFSRFYATTGVPFILEKTCANTLRVSFLAALFPSAKFIHITRDGLDAAYSASLAWQSSFQFFYILRKLRFVPLSGLFPYFNRYSQGLLRKIFKLSTASTTWGPVYPGMHSDLTSLPLLDVCAKQWKLCNDVSHSDLKKLPLSQVIHLSYESFVVNPKLEVSNILSFLGLQYDSELMHTSISNVKSSSIGKALREMSPLDALRLTNYFNS